jgi:hypothetical protein
MSEAPIFQAKRVTASMKGSNIGQINFDTGDQTFCFQISRTEFQRLRRRMAGLLNAMPSPRTTVDQDSDQILDSGQPASAVPKEAAKK